MDTTSATPETVDDARRRELWKLHRELGPTVSSALEDPKTVEVLLNADGRLWQEKLSEPMREIGTMPAVQAEAIVRTVAAMLKRTVTREHPWVEGQLPDGSRFAGQIPPLVSAPVFSIRKRASAVFPLSDYVASGIMTAAQKETICQAVNDHRNFLISGSTGTGKTTMVNAIIAEIVRQFPGQRLLILEDTDEIQCPAENSQKYLTSPEVSMTQLVRLTMRMRPDRLMIGETRGPEALDWMDACNTGHPGGVCTLHSNNARAALSRLRMLVSRHPESPKPVEPLIGEVMPIIIHIIRDPERGRRVREILEVTGFGPEGYQTQAL
jgi:P-type conjugative transfer ATPase TrbB